MVQKYIVIFTYTHFNWTYEKRILSMTLKTMYNTF